MDSIILIILMLFVSSYARVRKTGIKEWVYRNTSVVEYGVQVNVNMVYCPVEYALVVCHKVIDSRNDH
jgi:hypothetical protein